ncbi:MAG: ABC transporter ATP-binding protein [Comamonadaceae bacterium]
MSQPTARIALNRVGLRFAAAHGSGKSHTVLQDVSLALAEGEFVCLLGSSGCGKSSILNLLAGFIAPDHGTLEMDGQIIHGPGPQRGMVFQQPTLFPWLSVRDNVTFGPRMAGLAADRYLPEADRFLRLVGLQDYAEHYPWQLSGGMRQRVALARAWLADPQVLLMDEPFGALDAQTRLSMQELLTHIWQTTRTTILFVTHDVDEALYLADRILIMSAAPGRIREELRLPFERPRSLEDLVADPGYGKLKRRILHVVREEARKSFSGVAA